MELIEAMNLLEEHQNIKLMVIGSTFYGNDTNDDFYRYVISQEGIALDEDYSAFRINSNYALLDGANMPHLTFNQDGVDYEINYDVIGFNRMNWLELFVGSGLVYFDLSSYEPFVALAFAGYYDNEGQYDIYYYANYANWVDTAAAEYKLLSPLLDQVSGAVIRDYKTENDGNLITTTYSNGTVVKVDLEEKTIDYDGKHISLAEYEQEGGIRF